MLYCCCLRKVHVISAGCTLGLHCRNSSWFLQVSMRAIPVHTCPCRLHCPLEHGPPPRSHLRPVVTQTLLFTALYLTLLFQTFCRSNPTMVSSCPSMLHLLWGMYDAIQSSMMEEAGSACRGVTPGWMCERSECPKVLLAQWAWMVQKAAHRTGSSSQNQGTHKELNLHSRFLPR